MSSHVPAFDLLCRLESFTRYNFPQSSPPPISKRAQPTHNHNLNNEDCLHVGQNASRAISLPRLIDIAIDDKPENVIPEELQKEEHEIGNGHRLWQFLPLGETQLPHDHYQLQDIHC